MCLIIKRNRLKRRIFLKGDTVDVIDFFGCRVRGKVNYATDSYAFVEFTDSSSTRNIKQFPLDDLLLSGPHVNPKPKCDELI